MPKRQRWVILLFNCSSLWHSMCPAGPSLCTPFTDEGGGVVRLPSALHQKCCLVHHMLRCTALCSTTQGCTKVCSCGPQCATSSPPCQIWSWLLFQIQWAVLDTDLCPVCSRLAAAMSLRLPCLQALDLCFVHDIMLGNLELPAPYGFCSVNSSAGHRLLLCH